MIRHPVNSGADAHVRAGKQEDLTSMAKAATSSRAPRGTKVLTQAFFSAAEEIPEGQRDAVVKAAFVAIRDTLKEAREKAKTAKAGKQPRGRTTESTRTTRSSAAKGRKTGAARRGRPAARQASEMSSEASE
jgi:hypothetical protein